MEAIPPPDNPEAKSEEQRSWYKPWHGFVAWLVLFLSGQVYGWHQRERMAEDIRKANEDNGRKLEQQADDLRIIKAMLEEGGRHAKPQHQGHR